MPGRWNRCLVNCRNISLQPESYKAIYDNMCKFKCKSLISNTWKTNSSNEGSSSGFNLALKGDIYTTLICIWVKWEQRTRSLGICGSFTLSEVKKFALLCIYCHIFFISPKLLIKLAEMEIYATGMRATSYATKS